MPQIAYPTPELTTRAARYYLWLWLSPLVTLPTALILLALNNGGIDDLRVSLLLAGSWHIFVYYKPSTSGEPFLRWHARQALIIGVIRAGISAILDPVAIVVQLLIWAFGTYYFRHEAQRGVCTLQKVMRADHSPSAPETIVSPSMEEAARDATANSIPAAEMPLSKRPEQWIETIRWSRDSAARQAALEALRRADLVESL